MNNNNDASGRSKGAVLLIGESMGMRVQSAPGEPARSADHIYVAGAESNVAIGLARQGVPVRYISNVGCDLAGRVITCTLREQGVDDARINVIRDAPTGWLVKHCTGPSGGDPRVEYHRKGSAASRLGKDDLTDDDLRNSAHLHMTGILPALSATTNELAEHAMRRARSRGLRVSFDPNLRPALWESTAQMRARINHLALLADFVMPGIEEARLLTGRDTLQGMAEFYLDLGVQAVVIKLGPGGAYVRNQAGYECTVRAEPVEVVDTVGAGDAFAAGFISAVRERCQGADVYQWADVLYRANRAAAEVIQRIGDW